MKIGKPNLLVGSDADGDIYQRASSLLARLAKGAADLKLFMNAGATAGEWAVGHMTGTFTRDMTASSGDVSYTGVGFKPSALIFFGGINATTIISMIGCSMATRRYVMSDYHGGIADTFAVQSALSIMLAEGSSQLQTALIKTYDSDGFTLTWTKTGTPSAGTATMFYVAFR